MATNGSAHGRDLSGPRTQRLHDHESHRQAVQLHRLCRWRYDYYKWWWPVPPDVKEVFWPADVARAETIGAFSQAFGSVGFQECSSEDLESGFERIALFANTKGIPLHAARQRASGRWT